MPKRPFAAIKALGAKRWQALHRDVYAIAGLALLHFFWMRAGDNDFAEGSVHALIIGALLGWRLFASLRGSARPAQRLLVGSQAGIADPAG